jgi:hypothetical protein
MDRASIITALRPAADELDRTEAVLFRTSCATPGARASTKRAQREMFRTRAASLDDELRKQAYQLGLVASGLFAWLANQLLWWVVGQLSKAIARRWLDAADPEHFKTPPDLRQFGSVAIPGQ